MMCGARAPSNQLAGWGAARHMTITVLATSRASTQTTLVKFVAAFSCLLFVWFAGDMKSGKRKVVLQSLDVAFSAPSRKSFPSRPSFLRRPTSTGFASKRFWRWQSENQKDSRLGRVRIIISDGTCALLNAQQIKMVRHACVPS